MTFFLLTLCHTIQVILYKKWVTRLNLVTHFFVISFFSLSLLYLLEDTIELVSTSLLLYTALMLPLLLNHLSYLCSF